MKERQYKTYEYSKKEWIAYLSIASFALLLVGKTFYDNFLVGILFSPVLILFFKKRKQTLCLRRKKQLEREFREAILSVSAGLSAGYSVENAFLSAYKDIVLLFGKESDMAYELSMIMKKLRMNQPIEQLLMDLVERSDAEDIRDFAEVFQIAKRSGGDLRQAIDNTAAIIREKGEVEQEIEVMLAQKKLEKNIMLFIPFFMIGYLSITSKGYFTPLYHNPKGIVVSTVCLLLYLLACYLMTFVMRIEV